MTYEAIKIVLEKYNISTIDQLEYCLSTFDATDECMDDPEHDSKNCMNAKCYEEYGVPDCRKIVEIYNKYFQKDIKTKKDFIYYLEKEVDKKKSSIANYMSCKSCNQQIEKGIQTGFKISDSDFKKDFCNNLSIKFSYESLFQTEYLSIKQFLNKEHQITSESFIPKYQESEEAMTKEEEQKLFQISHTSKAEFQQNLQDKENLQGSYIYLFNLASYAFDRNLVDECETILNKIFNEFKEQLQSENLMQLKAKILSSKQKDKDAISLLRDLIKTTHPQINAETYNLLAASIKRDAFKEFELYGDEDLLIKKLNESKDIYYSVYKLNNDYYPALNYIYLLLMLAHINDEKKEFFEKIIDESKRIWATTNHKITDWWSFISNVEFLILIGQYDKAKIELKEHFNEIDKEDKTEFNISATLRQLKLYKNFCNEKELDEIINYITMLTNYTD
jgi:hypothetical protein